LRYVQLFSGPVLCIILCACQKELTGTPGFATPVFDTIPVVKLLASLIGEASGIADSKANPCYLWVQEDSGNPPELTLLNHNGTTLKKIYVKNATNRDWEDMALSGNDLYVADIGDNAQVYPAYSIYKFSEPASSADTINSTERIQFMYPDGSHDAEAFLIDPVTKDIFIITKRDIPARIYKLNFPYAALSTVSLAGSLPYSFVTSAALSPDGKEIMVRTYNAVTYYKILPGQSIDQALQGSYKSLSHVQEPQGEALTFANDNSGFYTLSEKGAASSVSLYFYKRN
jgi:hypothetical protein